MQEITSKKIFVWLLTFHLLLVLLFLTEINMVFMSTSLLPFHQLACLFYFIPAVFYLFIFFPPNNFVLASSPVVLVLKRSSLSRTALIHGLF